MMEILEGIIIGVLLYLIIVVIYKKTIGCGIVLHVGSTYSDPKPTPYEDHFFKPASSNKWDHTHDYVKVITTEKCDYIDAGELVLFDKYREPKKYDTVLFERGGQYRIGRCISTGKLPGEPNLFDGIETPGIGYTLVGVAKYHEI